MHAEERCWMRLGRQACFEMTRPALRGPWRFGTPNRNRTCTCPLGGGCCIHSTMEAERRALYRLCGTCPSTECSVTRVAGDDGGVCRFERARSVREFQRLAKADVAVCFLAAMGRGTQRNLDDEFRSFTRCAVHDDTATEDAGDDVVNDGQTQA